MTDAELGAALRRAGLTPRALVAAWGTSIVAHLPRTAAALPATPATAALRLFVARAAVSTGDAARGLGPAMAALADRSLIDVGPSEVRARHAIVPIGPSLVCCDEATWPDDSSHHLIGCLPATRARRWLDVGTGCAVAPLARPDRAAAIVAADVDPAVVALARLGVGLSGVRHVHVVVTDLAGDTGDGFGLITFNLPIPGEAGLTRPGDPLFRRSPPGAGLLARFTGEIGARLARDATVVLHTWLGSPIDAVVDALPGEVTVVRYTPDGDAAFGVVRWRPDAAPAHRRGRRTPTAEAPHLRWDDLESAT